MPRVSNTLLGHSWLRWGRLLRKILSTCEEKRAGDVTFKESVTEGCVALSVRPYPPEGVSLKLARAHGHLQELHGEIDTYFKSPPFRIALFQDESGLNY